MREMNRRRFLKRTLAATAGSYAALSAFDRLVLCPELLYAVLSPLTSDHDGTIIV